VPASLVLRHHLLARVPSTHDSLDCTPPCTKQSRSRQSVDLSSSLTAELLDWTTLLALHLLSPHSAPTAVSTVPRTKHLERLSSSNQKVRVFFVSCACWSLTRNTYRILDSTWTLKFTEYNARNSNDGECNDLAAFTKLMGGKNWSDMKKGNETKRILRGAVTEHMKNLRSRPFQCIDMLHPHATSMSACCCMRHVDNVCLVCRRVSSTMTAIIITSAHRHTYPSMFIRTTKLKFGNNRNVRNNTIIDPETCH
jgi:hypothetical protein